MLLNQQLIIKQQMISQNIIIKYHCKFQERSGHNPMVLNQMKINKLIQFKKYQIK